ncbi:hypothetical protein AB8A24_22795, partial [Streptomyces sp. BF23-19]
MRPQEPREAQEPDTPDEPGEPKGPWESGEPDEEAARLPVLLEAVLDVGSELELHSTLQHIVDSAAELCAARYGALGVAGGSDTPSRSRTSATARGSTSRNA